MPSYPFTPSKSRWVNFLRPHPRHEGFMAEAPPATPAAKPRSYYKKSTLSTPTLRLTPPDETDAGKECVLRSSTSIPTSSSATPLLSLFTSPETPGRTVPTQAPRSASPSYMRTDPTPPQLKRLYFANEPLVDLSQAPIKKYFPAPVSSPNFKFSSTEEVPVFKGRYKLRHKERMSLPGNFCTPKKPMPRYLRYC